MRRAPGARTVFGLALLVLASACGPGDAAEIGSSSGRPGGEVVRKLDAIAALRAERLDDVGGAAAVTEEEARRLRGVWHRMEAGDDSDSLTWAVEINGAADRIAFWGDGIAAAPLALDQGRLTVVTGEREIQLDADGYPLYDTAGRLDDVELVRREALAALEDRLALAPAPPAGLDAWSEWIGHYATTDAAGAARTIVLHERIGRPAFEIDSLLLVMGTWTGDGFALDANPLGEGAARARRATGAEPAALEIGDTRWIRVAVGTDEGETFRIEPAAPVEELRRTALAAEPPVESGELLAPDLVEITSLEPGIRLDVRYATADNFMGVPFYREPRAFLQRPAAEAVAEVHRRLAAYGLGLLVHDGYRPWHVTRMFWDATPEHLREFVADPAQGSRHNRGAAVDLTLFYLATGEPVTMTGGYDEFSVRSYPDYPGGTTRQRWHRELLRRLMEEAGFTVYSAEWWHFDFRGWERYPILDATFEEIVPGGTLER